MDIREIGTPITATQRRCYRSTPDAGFFSAYQAAFTAHTASAEGNDAKAASSRSLEEILGSTHNELSAMRGVDASSQRSYAQILEKAYSTGGMNDAKGFLAGLTPQELDTVRRNHCLADTIDVASLSEEGAQNLLLPEGYVVDLNHDGYNEVGAAVTASFPPANAPADVREAWFQATAGMDEGQMATYGLMMHNAIYGMRIDGQTSTPNYAADQSDSYRKIVDNYLASLDWVKGFMAEGQYERDKAFFSKLQSLLGAGAA
ncbi:MAG: hypothetical protein D3M94_18650 [Rhodocyclales bacterium GT-UBC]|nr:MAG: hypothetical protein D3M94_18650 [Rhodocyclales bacterium GT-UBC]